MVLKLSELMVRKPLIHREDPLILGLSMLAGKDRSSPYRVVVVDDESRVQGILTGRRVLEVLTGYRGESLWLKYGLHGILRLPIFLFIDEARHIFTCQEHPQTILQYMSENDIGHVIIVDDHMSVKGVIDEFAILNRLRGKTFGIKVKEVMTRNVHTIGPNALLMEAAKKMISYKVRRLPVIEHGRVKGLITITDILNHIMAKDVELVRYDTDITIENVLSEEVRNVMSSNVIYVRPTDDVGIAIDKVLTHDISGLVVMGSNNDLLGIVSRIDLVTRLSKVLGVGNLLELME